MDQTIINWLLAGFGALIGFLLNAVWQAVKDLQTADKVLSEKVGNIEVLVAGAYVKKDEFTQSINALFAKLDKIEDKVKTAFENVVMDWKAPSRWAVISSTAHAAAPINSTAKSPPRWDRSHGSPPPARTGASTATAPCAGPDVKSSPGEDSGVSR